MKLLLTIALSGTIASLGAQARNGKGDEPLVGTRGAQEVEGRERSVAVAPLIPVDRVKKAIDTYVPVLVMHRDERYMPTSFEEFEKVSEIYSYEDRDSKQTYVGRRLRNQPNPGDIQKKGAPDKAKVYVNVKVGEATTDLQYWFLYAYNGPGTAYLKKLDWNLRYAPIGDYETGEMGVHEGDWEHLTVTIDNKTGNALETDSLYMSAHGEGRWVNMPEHMAYNQGRNRVYASKNGHALFNLPLRDYYNTVKAGLVEFRLLNDTEKPGVAIDFKDRWELIGIQGDPGLAGAWGYKQQSWIRDFPGRWGRVQEKPHPMAEIPVLGKITEKILKTAGAYNEMTFEAGPYPPWSKSSFKGEE